MSATITKAMPVQSRSPVKKYTMAAMMMAGSRAMNSFMRTMIIKPIMTRTTRRGKLSQEGSPKLLRRENIVGRNNARLIGGPQEY